MQNPIIRGVIEVTFCSKTPGKGRFDALNYEGVNCPSPFFKVSKRPFPVVLEQKVTSMTPFIIGF